MQRAKIGQQIYDRQNPSKRGELASVSRFYHIVRDRSGKRAYIPHERVRLLCYLPLDQEAGNG